MKIAIVYDSSTGTTAKAAETMGKTMEAHGHHCRVQSVAQADPADVSEADLICVGSWVQGFWNLPMNNALHTSCRLPALSLKFRNRFQSATKELLTKPLKF